MPTASAPSMTSRGRSSDSASVDAAIARLGAASRIVGDELRAALPGMRAALERDVTAWLDLAERLAAATAPVAGATLAYLRLEPARVRRLGLDALGRWVDATAAL